MQLREIILDTETTGLDPSIGHKLVEIGALEMVNKVLTGKKFHYYINPQRDMPDEAYRIHGISGEFLKNKPLFDQIAEEFLTFIEGGALVIHNATFDLKFINHELSLLQRPFLDSRNTIDTLILARKMFPGAKVNLDALCKKFKIDNSKRQLHGALKDAALLAEVYIELTGGRQTSFNMLINKQADASSQRYTSISTQVVLQKPTQQELKNHKLFVDKILHC